MIAFTCLFCGLLLIMAPVTSVQGNGDGPYTDPEGDISVSGDAKSCSGGYKIPVSGSGVTQTMTLTADDLEDLDCEGSYGIEEDDITNPSGIKWAITPGSPGTFSGGDTGSPKDWDAPTSVETGLTIELKLKDDGDIYQDWSSHQEVKSKSFAVVVPDSVNQGSSNPVACGTTYGKKLEYPLNSVSHACAALDFEGLHLYENLSDDMGCTVAGPSPGSGCDIIANNALQVTCRDMYGMCTNTCPVSAGDPSCTEDWDQTYYINSTSNVMETVTITWTFTWNGGSCDCGFGRVE